MSDSDEDIMGETIHRLRHNIMNSAASNVNNSNITSFSYRQNSVTSTFKPNNYREINVLQNPNQVHNMYYRRETSPMSLRSLCHSRPQSFRNYPDGRSSHISTYNGRGGSPTSMRSIDSNSSVNAVVIAHALSSNKFNKCDLRLIKAAYIKLMKNQTRKRIGKRKKLKLYMKGHRRNPGDEDSGEQGSDSSMSSDDCRSTRTFQNSKTSGLRSRNMDVTHFRSSIRERDMYIDRTDTLRQPNLQNIPELNNTNETDEKHDTIIYQNQKCNGIVQQTAHKNISNITLKKQLTKGTNSYLLPSQRFNKTNVNSNNTVTSINQRKNIQNGDKNNEINQQNINTDSKEAEIFSEITIHKNPQQSQQKRFLEDSEAVCSDKKRYKVTSTNLTQNDCHFKRPQRPARKCANNKRESIPEMIIAMSKPLPDSIHLDLPQKASDNLDQIHNKSPINSTKIDKSSNQREISQNATDVSMRPSFIKRKLFTQKLDVAENNNLISDNVESNSPQTKLYSGVREKNKVRKLVTSQSCLSRDVLSNDNMLDLIHKIVPRDKMPVTMASNKREINKTNENDKWDVTSVISTCNTSDVSDTFTDEEIFKTSSNLDKRPKTKQQVAENVKNPVDLINNNKPKIATPCKVTGQKLPITKSNENPREIEANKSKCPNKKSVSSCIKSFWDTDFESDIEETNVTPLKSSKCVVGEEIEKGTICNNTVTNVVNKKNNTEETILTIPSLQNKTIDNSMMSDENKTRKKTIIEENKDNNIIAKNSESNKESQTHKNLNKDAKNKKSKPMKKDSESKLEIENLKPKSVQTKKKATKKENTGNTSRQSLRLKEKNENKELAKCNISKENDDPIKVNKSTTRNNTRNNKNNNIKKNNNDNTMTSSVEKNNTIEQTPKKKRQTRNFLATPATESNFNINNRSLRVRYKKYNC